MDDTTEKISFTTGVIGDTLTSVVVRENERFVGTIFEIYEGLLYKETFKLSFNYFLRFDCRHKYMKKRRL